MNQLPSNEIIKGLKRYVTQPMLVEMSQKLILYCQSLRNSCQHCDLIIQRGLDIQYVHQAIVCSQSTFIKKLVDESNLGVS